MEDPVSFLIDYFPEKKMRPYKFNIFKEEFENAEKILPSEVQEKKDKLVSSSKIRFSCFFSSSNSFFLLLFFVKFVFLASFLRPIRFSCFFSSSNSFFLLLFFVKFVFLATFLRQIRFSCFFS
jgi:hypothetical protein